MLEAGIITKFKNKCDVSRAMEYSFAILKYTGHFPFENETKPIGRYLLYYSIMYGTMLISESIYLWIVFGDIDKMAETMYLYITHMGIFYKSYNMIMRYPIICKLLADLSTDHQSQMNSRQQKIVNEAKKNFGTLVFGYYTCAFFFWLLTVVSPLAQNHTALPLGCWYPFDYTKPKWYELAYVQQTASIFFIAGVTLALDCVLIFLMQQTGIHLDLLKDEFLYLKEKVKEVAASCNGQEETNESQIQDKLLIKAVHHHQALIRLTTLYIIYYILLKV